MNKSYEQQPKEADQTYEKFVIYRDLPYYMRTPTNAYRKYCEIIGEEFSDIGRTKYTNVYARWNFKGRAEDYDRDQEASRKVSEFQTQLDQFRQLKRERLDIGLTAIEASKDLLQKGLEAAHAITVEEITIKNIDRILHTAIELADFGLVSLADALGLEQMTNKLNMKVDKTPLRIVNSK